MEFRHRTYKNPTYSANKTSQEIEKEARYIEKENVQYKHDHLRFLLAPDVYDPTRIPSSMSFPTHIFRDSGSVTITPTGGRCYLIWCPRLMSYSSALISTTEAITTNVTATSLLSEVYHRNGYTGHIPTGFDTSGVRLIGAVCKVTYQGSWEDTSGSFEVGIQTHNNTAGGNLKTIALSDMQKTYHYKKLKPQHGCRMIWFPARSEHLEYEDQGNNYAYHIHASGFPVNAECIRVDFVCYYEGHPGTSVFDTYLPVKSKQVVSDNKVTLDRVDDIVKNLSITSATVSPGGEHNGGFMGYIDRFVKTASSIYNTIEPFVEPITQFVTSIL
jgi:hypothetical protein